MWDENNDNPNKLPKAKLMYMHKNVSEFTQARKRIKDEYTNNVLT